MSHAEGNATVSHGQASHAEGVTSEANGVGSHAEGISTNAVGNYSHAEGQETIASATTAHVGGYQSSTYANYSFVHGNNNTLTNVAVNSAILGGSGITGTYPNTTYVPNLNIWGSNVSATENGSIWNDNTQKAFKIFENNISQTLGGVIFSQTGNTTVSGTTTETSIIGNGIGKLTLPADFFVAGKTLRFYVSGFHSSVSNPFITIRILLSGVTLASATLTCGAGTNDGFEIFGNIVCKTTGVTGSIVCNGRYDEIHSSGGSEGLINTSNITVNTTVAQTFNITIEWGTASASNTITSQITTIEVLN